MRKYIFSSKTFPSVHLCFILVPCIALVPVIIIGEKKYHLRIWTNYIYTRIRKLESPNLPGMLRNFSQSLVQSSRRYPNFHSLSKWHCHGCCLLWAEHWGGQCSYRTCGTRIEGTFRLLPGITDFVTTLCGPGFEARKLRCTCSNLKRQASILIHKQLL